MVRGWCARTAERHRTALSFALLFAGYVSYLLVGAGIFSAVELPYEEQLRRELQDARRDFLAENPCVSVAGLDALLARALEANNYGVSLVVPKGNDTTAELQTRNWDFVSALFFTSTVLTTTGESDWGGLTTQGSRFLAKSHKLKVCFYLDLF